MDFFAIKIRLHRFLQRAALLLAVCFLGACANSPTEVATPADTSKTGDIENPSEQNPECVMLSRERYGSYSEFADAYEIYTQCLRTNFGDEAVPEQSAAELELIHVTKELGRPPPRPKVYKTLDYERAAARANGEREREQYLIRQGSTRSKKFSTRTREITQEEYVDALKRARQEYERRKATGQIPANEVDDDVGVKEELDKLLREISDGAPKPDDQ